MGGTPVRLFCLPYSGASAMTYSRWRRKLPAWLAVRPVELPGRGWPSRCRPTWRAWRSNWRASCTTRSARA
ncbi:thioesterase domain-containing protein, partial [Serratia marcescens]|uniref:thioesterase domain-containing protein n=1 Tax=Serratia marcescens TaxID=615 RepID=UPI0023B81949